MVGLVRPQQQRRLQSAKIMSGRRGGMSGRRGGMSGRRGGMSGRRGVGLGLVEEEASNHLHHRVSLHHLQKRLVERAPKLSIDTAGGKTSSGSPASPVTISPNTKMRLRKLQDTVHLSV